MNGKQFLYVITHFNEDKDIPIVVEHVTGTKYEGDELEAKAMEIVEEIKTEIKPEEKMALMISLKYHIPYNEVFDLPPAVLKYLIAAMKAEKKPEQPKNDILKMLMSGVKNTKVKQTSGVYASPDDEIDKIWKKQFGDE